MLCLDCTRCEDYTFQNKVRTMLQQQTVFKAAGFVFAGIADEIAGKHRCLDRSTPLRSSRKACAAAPPKPGRDDLAKNHHRIRIDGVTTRSTVLLECLFVGCVSLRQENHRKR